MQHIFCIIAADGIVTAAAGDIFDIFDRMIRNTAHIDSYVGCSVQIGFNRFCERRIIHQVIAAVAAVDRIAAEVRSGKGVVPLTADQIVRSSFTVDQIVALITLNCVSIVITGQCVRMGRSGQVFDIFESIVPISRCTFCEKTGNDTAKCPQETDRIPAPFTVDHVVSVVAFDRIVIDRSCNVFKTADRIVTNPGILCCRGFEINMNTVLGIFETERIGTAATVEGVITLATFNRIVSGIA